MKTVHACLVYIVLGILGIYCLTFHWMLLWLQVLLGISFDVILGIQLLLGISLAVILATGIAWHFIGCYFGYRYCLAFHWMLFCYNH